MIQRCSVHFENASDLLAGLAKFKQIVEMEDSVESRQLKGCFVSIVRMKNMLNEIKQWDMNDLSHCHYCDLKANCLIQVHNKKMIVEVQVKCFIVSMLFLYIIYPCISQLYAFCMFVAIVHSLLLILCKKQKILAIYFIHLSGMEVCHIYTEHTTCCLFDNIVTINQSN